ncbi:MAG: CHASE2 domain-containing protein [Spirochaetaceae bacterium]|nr:CHASE2 domain-containing protein [Spirochaetaceae bacterium]
MGKAKSNNSFIVVTLAVFMLSMLLFLTPLDKKFFDLFLRILPSLSENEKVYVLTLDDDSIAYAGGFPFRREVMADVVVLLRELGVDTIAFDLSYLDESPQRLDPVYAAELSSRGLDSFFIRLSEAAEQAIDGIGPSTSRKDKELYKQDIRTLYRGIRDEVEASLAYMTRDVDEYFAQSLAFGDCSWLTLTMIRSEDIFGDTLEESVAKNADIDRYLAEHISLKNVVDAGDSKTREMVGVMPAIHKLMSRAKGAGFVNAFPDSDGLRRRINLLIKYNGDYYGQLTLMAIQKKMGWSSIEISDSLIKLKMENGKDIRIPRAEDGSILLKWPKKLFYDYKMMSLIELIQYTMIEPAFAENIAIMNDSGFFYFWDGDNPWEYYQESLEIKRKAFENNEAADDEWLRLRQGFFDICGAFLKGKAEEAILAEVGDDKETVDFVQDLFDVCRSQYNRLAEIRKNTEGLQGSFCVIGSDATSMTDIGLITFQEFYPNVGTYAVAANMLLSGEFLDDAPWYVSAVIALLSSFLIGALISRFDTYRSIITGLSCLILLSGAFIAFFVITKIYIGFSAPLAATLGTFVFIMVDKFLTASKEKAFLHTAFSRYIAPEIISEIINDPDKLNLGGEKRNMTTIFTDIQGFSAISEKVDPTVLVKLLNQYLTAMSNIIMENKGTIDKYVGDAIIAFFGAPIYHPSHAILACRSALAMKAAEEELNKKVLEEGLSPVPLFTRIGINTGEMVVGNMGAEDKMNYTIMGNAVNLAARLEGVNKQYHTGGILISEYTKEKIGNEFMCRRIDRVRVVGINTPLRLYELLGLMENADKNKIMMLNYWEQAINHFEKMLFEKALEEFENIVKRRPNDRVAVLYADRCKAYMKKPPPADWDAVNNLTEK